MELTKLSYALSITSMLFNKTFDSSFEKSDVIYFRLKNVFLTVISSEIEFCLYLQAS